MSSLKPTQGPQANDLLEPSKLLAEILQERGQIVMQANGRSMFPTLVKGDRIHLKACTKEEARIGEIIFARFGKLYCLHRVVKEVPLTTKGDALDQVDPPIEEVFGKVVEIQKTFFSRIRRWKIFVARHIAKAESNHH